MTKEELFEIQQIIGSAAFNLKNWSKVLKKNLPDDFSCGKTNPMTKEEFFASMDKSLKNLFEVSQKLRKECAKN